MATKKNTNTNPILETAVSPYGLAKFLNANVEGLSIEPQRMYQYVRSGKLVVELNQLDHKVVTPENGNAFIAWFLDPERKTQKAEEAEASEAEAEATAS